MSLPYPLAVERHPRVRQSLLAAFDRCPLAVKFDLTHSSGWSSHDQARGTLFHRTAARCLNVMAEEGEDSIPPEVAVAILEDVLRQDDVDRACYMCGSVEWKPGGSRDFVCGDCGHEGWSDVVAVPGEHIANLRMSVVKWAKDSEFRIENLLSVEERLSAEVYYPSEFGPVGRTISGQLDALFASGDHGVVLDWKDTWGLPPESGVSFGGYFQQRCYGLLVMTRYPALKKVTLREVYHRWGEHREVTLTREELPQVEAEMSALVERFDRAVERDIWKPSPGKHCSYCPTPRHCPIDPEARGAGRIENDEMARRTAAEAVKAKAIASQATAALRAYADRTGRPISVADAKGRTAFGYVKKETVMRPDREQVEAALRAAGADGKVDVDKLFVKRKGTTFKSHTPDDLAKPTPEDAQIAEMMRSSVDAVRDRAA